MIVHVFHTDYNQKPKKSSGMIEENTAFKLLQGSLRMMNWTQGTTFLTLPTTPAEGLPFRVIPLDLKGALLDLWEMKDNTISILWGSRITYKHYTSPSNLN